MRVVRLKLGSSIRLVVILVVVIICYVAYSAGHKEAVATDQRLKKEEIVVPNEEGKAKAENINAAAPDYPDFGANDKGADKEDKIDPDRQVLPKRDHSKLAFPHIEGNEIPLEHPKEADPNRNSEVAESWDGRKVTLIGRGEDLTVPLPVYLPHEKIGNYEPVIDKTGHDGPGEEGARVNTLPEEEEHVKEIIKEFGFNLVNSDKISMDRLPKDLRDKTCKHIDYPEKLPTVSVIVVFHNEGWGPLVRTFHSVVNRTPPELLGEIVVIDDGSIIKDKPHLGDPLAEYIKRWNGLVKLYRNDRREGLIRARSIGAEHATQEVLVFLDAHCEAGYNWLPPLLAPIARNDRISTVPLIDVIDGQHYTFTGQAGGDVYGRAQGGWEWNFLWKRYPLPQKEGEKLKDKSEPYPSPAMAGGLFAISRQYFYDIGMYDPGLEIWGGENFEISYKLWMCGGGMLFVPCSRVGHVYRLEGWGGNPPPEYVPSNPSFRNYLRVIEVWWDDWKKYFYWNRPELSKLEYGDIGPQKKFRHDHCPHDFDWMMKEIAYGITEKYDWPSELQSWGEIRGVGSNLCIDSMGKKDGNAQTWYCHKQGGNQLFRVNLDGQIAQNLQCLYPKSNNKELAIRGCEGVKSQANSWKFDEKAQIFYYKGKCLTRGSQTETGDLSVEPCVEGNILQKWEMHEEAVF